MTELRWNPTVREWVSTASHRQGRPQMPQDWCPFCPGSGRVPDHYDVHIYPNDFAAFSIPAPPPAIKGDDFYKVRPSRGKCDVVLYHPGPSHFAAAASRGSHCEAGAVMAKPLSGA